jgi:hypothetical protein
MAAPNLFATSLPFTVEYFEVQSVLPYNGPKHAKSFTVEAEAIEYARSLAGPHHTLVSLHASGDYNNFAYAYFEYDKPDTGWRTWINGNFAGGFPLGGSL